MFKTLTQKFLQINPLVLVSFFVVIQIALLAWYYPGPLATGDAGTKIIQVQDFIRSDFSNFHCQYAGKAIDPEMEFIPFRFPFVFLIKGQCLNIFPPYQIVLYTPIYIMAGTLGVYFIAAISVMLIFLVSWRITVKLQFSQAEQLIALVLVATCCHLFAYGLSLNEHALTALLALSGIHLSLFESYWRRFMAGILIGCAMLLRVESAVLAAIIPVMFFVAQDGVSFKGLVARSLSFVRSSQFASMLIFVAGFLVVLIPFFIINFQIANHVLGLRAFDRASGSPEDFLDKLYKLYQYFWGRSSSLLKENSISLVALLGFFQTSKLLKDWRARFLLYTAFAYMLIVAWSGPMDGGPQLGERFFFSVFPLLAILALKVYKGLAENSNSKWGLRVKRVVLILLWVIPLLTLSQTIRGIKKAHKLERAFNEQAAYVKEVTQGVRVIIYRQKYLRNLMSMDYHNRYYFIADTDPGFIKLTQSLANKGIHKIAVLHSRLPFRGARFGMPDELLPPSIKVKSQSPDLGKELFELRIVEF